MNKLSFGTLMSLVAMSCLTPAAHTVEGAAAPGAKLEVTVTDGGFRLRLMK